MPNPMTAEEFAAFMSEGVTQPENFRPVVFYNPDGDCIEVILSPEPFVGEPVAGAGNLTVYRGRESGAVVGVLVEKIRLLTMGV